jgi:phage tail sheath gpL-like
MATIYDMVVVAHDETSTNAQRDLIAESGYSMLAGLKLKDYFKMITSGIRPGVVQTKVNAVKATGTITFSSHANTNTTTLNGITFTCVTSGATGNQYNVGADDAATAVNAAAAYNANTTLDGMVVATAASGVVTLTALVPGEMGNAFTLAISANGSVSAARMAGGTNGDVERTHYYGSAS